MGNARSMPTKYQFFVVVGVVAVDGGGALVFMCLLVSSYRLKEIRQHIANTYYRAYHHWNVWLNKFEFRNESMQIREILRQYNVMNGTFHACKSAQPPTIRAYSRTMTMSLFVFIVRIDFKCD